MYTLIEKFYVNLLLLILGFIILKILAFFIVAKVKNMDNKSIYAEDIISGNYKPKKVNKRPGGKPMKAKKQESVLGFVLRYYFLSIFKPKALEKTEEPELNTKEFKAISHTEDKNIKYTIVKAKFSKALRSKQLNRQQLLSIVDFLEETTMSKMTNRYKNEAHYIYSVMKYFNLSIGTFNKLETLLDTWCDVDVTEETIKLMNTLKELEVNNSNVININSYKKKEA